MSCEVIARKNRKLIAKTPISHCSYTLLCPLATMLTVRSIVCRAFPRSRIVRARGAYAARRRAPSWRAMKALILS